MRLAAPAVALLREVSPAWARALRERDDGPLDVEAARAQQRAYASALEAVGTRILWLPAGPEPDGCFTEDTAVLLPSVALATRPGAPSRRPEVGPVVDALVALGLRVHRMGPPGTLEGGDVLRLRDRLLVGRSRRSNGPGIAALAALAARQGLGLAEIEIPDQMHLKGAVTLAAEDLAVVDPAALDPARVEGPGLRVLEAAEPVGANVLALGEGRVLCPAEAPGTVRRLEALGLRCRSVVGQEIQRADGRLTCLSLRLPPPGAWSA